MNNPVTWSAGCLDKIKLATSPPFQKFIGHFLLTPNYKWLARVRINLEGTENIPRNRGVIFAMNHTDRFNYWPFQYKLWKMKTFRFTATWVKTAYFRNPALAKILGWCNTIPVPSLRSYIEDFFSSQLGKKPEHDHYRALKDYIDGKLTSWQDAARSNSQAAIELTENLAERIRLGYEAVMGKVAALSLSALGEKRLNLIIFPEGTRSETLGQGRTGLAQLAVASETPIVPVGCNNSNALYTGNLPFARSGKVTYRIGPALDFDGALSQFRIKESFEPFSSLARQRYRDVFEKMTQVIMEQIGLLLDEQHAQQAG